MNNLYWGIYNSSYPGTTTHILPVSEEIQTEAGQSILCREQIDPQDSWTPPLNQYMDPPPPHNHLRQHVVSNIFEPTHA